MFDRADIKDYEIIHTFDILHSGWEMDNVAWIAKNKKGDLVFLTTSHGGLCDYGRDITELHEKLIETKNSVAGIKKAIALINGAPKTEARLKSGAMRSVPHGTGAA